MKITNICWRKGFNSRGVSPEDAHAELEKIRSDKDNINPDDVVSAAKDKNNKLHKYFEWDDSKAGKAYRRQQAQIMINSVQVVYQEMPKQPIKAYSVVKQESFSSPTKAVYTTTEEMLGDQEMRQELLSRALRQAISFKKQYEHLVELADLMGTFDEIIENLEEAIAN